MGEQEASLQYVPQAVRGQPVRMGPFSLQVAALGACRAGAPSREAARRLSQPARHQPAPCAWKGSGCCNGLTRPRLNRFMMPLACAVCMCGLRCVVCVALPLPTCWPCAPSEGVGALDQGLASAESAGVNHQAELPQPTNPPPCASSHSVDDWFHAMAGTAASQQRHCAAQRLPRQTPDRSAHRQRSACPELLNVMDHAVAAFECGRLYGRHPPWQNDAAGLRVVGSGESTAVELSRRGEIVTSRRRASNRPLAAHGRAEQPAASSTRAGGRATSSWLGGHQLPLLPATARHLVLNCGCWFAVPDVFFRELGIFGLLSPCRVIPTSGAAFQPSWLCQGLQCLRDKVQGAAAHAQQDGWSAWLAAASVCLRLLVDFWM